MSTDLVILETPAKQLARRGTSNGNERGNSTDRARRKQFLLETYASDVRLQRVRIEYSSGVEVCIDLFLMTPEQLLENYSQVRSAEYVPTCRCFRCGCLLHFETLTVDRIIPGARGGRYVRTNIRPACGPCNSETGGALAHLPKKPTPKSARNQGGGKR